MIIFCIINFNMFLYKFSQSLNYLTPQKIRIAFTTKMLEFPSILK